MESSFSWYKSFFHNFNPVPPSFLLFSFSAFLLFSFSLFFLISILPDARDMVLQRAPAQAKLWGWAAANETVSVDFNNNVCYFTFSLNINFFLLHFFPFLISFVAIPSSDGNRWKLDSVASCYSCGWPL
jgi:hypothetical protein